MSQYVRDHIEQSKRYLRMSIGGMGNLSGNPSVLVMLLVPISETGKPIREVTEQLFPVPLTPPRGQVYFHRLVEVLKHGPERGSLFGSFLTASGTEILSLRVSSSGDRLTTTVKLKDREGILKSFIVRLEDALVHAVLEGIPIFVDEDILLNIGQQVSFHFAPGPFEEAEEPTEEQPERRQAKSPFELISDFIRSGSRPEEMGREMRNNVEVMLPRQRAELGEIAIETENYEWASFLKGLGADGTSGVEESHE